MDSIEKLVWRLYTTLKNVICFDTLPFGIFNFAFKQKGIDYISSAF